MSYVEVICNGCGGKTTRPARGTTEPCEGCGELDFDLVDEPDPDEAARQEPPDVEPARLRVEFEVHPSYEMVVFRDAVWTVFPEPDPRWLLVWTPGGFHTFDLDPIGFTDPEVMP